ncbi:hypothetical protein GLGCALEP_03262 [Pseudomonas sp. MM221]|nr:hypothetical protein GLGCALEP_03262 [Pseudomonas sp. MM221]
MALSHTAASEASGNENTCRYPPYQARIPALFRHCADAQPRADFSHGLPLDDNSQPPPTDPSTYTDQPADPNPALLNLSTLPEANEGSLELTDGVFGSRDTVRTDNVLPPALQTSDRYPTNGKPSPLFGAQPFTQQLLLFEEFGPEKLDPTTPAPG